ncbi:hypothetical protein TWF506_003255 [Arthrobotrys conoides]|uniref:Uncharacterized protein n=1 Tax=Arthrobotrys conoides TaxID=74498 RepID=A0AAN8RRN4_9PEZI
MTDHEFTLDFYLDTSILSLQSTDSLCIAQYVNKTVNTVYDHRSVEPVHPDKELPLSQKNVFRLSEDYKVFLVRYDEDTAEVQTQSAARSMKFGQVVTFKDNQLQDPHPAESGQLSQPLNSFGLENPPFDLRVAVEAPKEVPNGPNEFSTIYVDPTPHMPGVLVPITPEPKYFLFWHASVKDSELVHIPPEKQGYVVEFSRDDPKSKSVRYGYETKDKPRPNESPSWW